MKDCSSYMGGIDKADMSCSIYGVGRKSNKWWHHIFFGLLSCTLCNAYTVYKKLIEPSIILEFHCSIAQSLITLSKQPKVGKPRSTPSHVSVKKHTKYSVSDSESVPDSMKLQVLEPIMLYTRVNEGDVKSVQKEVFSQDHIVNATCVMFF